VHVGGAVRTCVLTCGGEQVQERPGRAGEQRPRALLYDAAAVEHGDVVGSRRRGQAVGDDDAGSSDEQALRRPDDAGLGHRVHPRGGLVQHHHLHVADQQARERHQLFLAGGQGGPPGSEDSVEPVRQPCHPPGEPELLHGQCDRGAGHVGEQGDVLRQRCRKHVGALGHHPDRGAQLLQVQ
jgi:hypothetical protein